MNIIYISALCSNNLVTEIFTKTHNNPGFAVQKFSRLLVHGLIENGQSVLALSNPPVMSPFSKKFFSILKPEMEDKIYYKYIPFINKPFIKHVCVFIYTFMFVLLWGFKKRKEKCVICDSLSVSATLAALLATKINRVKCCGVFTDIYGLMVDSGSKSLINHLGLNLYNKYSSMFTHYILLTEKMNSIVNPKQRPYIVMEAICDITENQLNITNVVKQSPPVILYAGGVYEKYGLKMLVEAFINTKDIVAELHIYGSGSYVSELLEQCKLDRRVKYFGVRSNSEVVNAERRATILINPRFTSEEFTKYSFPSKNMEYMVSGTPVLTTNLSGMPKDYHDFVYLIHEETIDGYSAALRKILNLEPEELTKKGKEARYFVLNNKNNIKQAKNIISLLNK